MRERRKSESVTLAVTPPLSPEEDHSRSSRLGRRETDQRMQRKPEP